MQDSSNEKKLAMAIVGKACEEYWYASHGRTSGFDSGGIGKPDLKACEDFFNSAWFQILMDSDIEPEYLMRTIREMPEPPKIPSFAK